MVFATADCCHDKTANDEEYVYPKGYEMRQFHDSPGSQGLSGMEPCDKEYGDRTQYLNPFNLQGSATLAM